MTLETEIVDLLKELLARVDSVETKLDSMLAKHSEATAKIDTIVNEVQPHLDTIAPVIDALMEHPFVRMAFPGIKNKVITP